MDMLLVCCIFGLFLVVQVVLYQCITFNFCIRLLFLFLFRALSPFPLDTNKALQPNSRCL